MDADAGAEEADGEEEEEVFFCRCGIQIKDHHLSVACDMCDKWYHVQCVGISKEQSEALSAKTFMCAVCAAEGFMVDGANWHVEQGVSAPAVLPQSSSSEEDSSDDEGRPRDGSGTSWGRV